MGALFAVVAGLLNAVQSGVNSTLGKGIGQFQAGLVSFVVGIMVFVVAGVVTGRLDWPGATRMAALPWWAWTGGLMGAVFVMTQLFVADSLGSAVFIGVIVTSSVVMSLVLDNYGLVGFEVHPVNLGRIAGAVLMIAGVGLIAWF